MRILVVLSVIAFTKVYCQMPSDPVDDLLIQIFGPNTNTSGDNPSVKGCEEGKVCVMDHRCKNALINIRVENPCSNENETCCSVEDTITTSVTIPPISLESCGFRNIGGVGFTSARDDETEFGEFPWMVAVLKEEKFGDQISVVHYECGGSLIHPRVVLTAAHCVQNMSDNTLRIRAGEWDTETKLELYSHQDRKVAEVAIHEHYYKGSLFNDIALLFLESPVELEENVKTICLPPAGSTFDFQRCIVTGWGKHFFGLDEKYQVILKKIDLPVVPRDECQNLLRATHSSKNFELHRSFICTGGEMEKEICKGDGGSPLVCPIPGTRHQYVQTGIGSWSRGCGQKISGVYADVAGLRSWLDEQLANEILTASFTHHKFA